MKKLIFGLLLLSSTAYADHAISLYDRTNQRYVQISAPDILQSSYTIVLPTTPALSGQTQVIESVIGKTLYAGWEFGGGSGGGVWGGITGTLSNQTDLQTILTSIKNSTTTLGTSVIALGTSTGTLKTSVVALGASTGTLLVSINALGASTGTLATSVTSLNNSVAALNTSTSSLQVSIIALGVSTGTLLASINSLGVSTGTLSVSTTSLQSQINGLSSIYLTLSSAAATYFNVNNILPVAHGGTGTASPGLVQGTNITITGSWPNQTINSTGGGSGGVTLSSFSATAPLVYNNTTGAFTIQPISLSTAVVGVLPVLNGGTGVTTPSLVAGTNIASITGTWPNQVINATTQGGGGTSALAVTTGTTAGFTTVASSPTGVLLFNSGQFIASSQGGATGYILINTSSITAQGNSISLAALSSSMTAVAVSTGALQTGLNNLAVSTAAIATSTSALQTQINTKINLSSITASVPITYNNTTGALALQPISLSTAVTGSLPAASIAAGSLGPNVIASSLSATSGSIGAGTNITISGVWPNQTVTASGGGGSGNIPILPQFYVPFMQLVSSNVVTAAANMQNNGSTITIMGPVGIGAAPSNQGWALDVRSSSDNARGGNFHVTCSSGTCYGMLGTSDGFGSTLNVGGYSWAANGKSNIGYWIEAPFIASTANWALYSQSPAQSYFGGYVGIGTAQPAFPLDVVGGGQFSGPVIASSYTSTGSGAGQWQAKQDVDSTIVPAVGFSTMWASVSSGTFVWIDGTGSTVTVTGSTVTIPTGHYVLSGGLGRLIDGGTGGGGGGSPGGSDGQIQIKSGSSFLGSPSVVTSSSFTFLGTVAMSTLAINMGGITATAPIQIGPNNGSLDAQIVIGRNVDNSVTGNGHAFADSSNITRGGTIGYNSFDAIPNITGPGPFDHYAGFQSAVNYNSTGTINYIYDYLAQAFISNSGSPTLHVDFYGSDPVLSGTAHPGTQIDFYVPSDPTSGSTANWGFYSGGHRNFMASLLLGTGDTFYTGNTSPALEINNSNADAMIRFYQNNQNIWDIVSASGTSRFGIRDIDQVEYWTIMADGKVGISTTAPTHLLEINGSMAVASSSTFNGNIYVSSGVLLNGSAGTNGQVYTSGGPGTIPSWTTSSGGGGSSIPVLPQYQMLFMAGVSSNVVTSSANMTNNGSTVTISNVQSVTETNVTTVTASGVLFNYNSSTMTVSSMTATSVSITTATFAGFTFATLGSSAPNGTYEYCADCTTSTPATCTANLLSSCTCAGSGTGAFARRLNGTWYCGD